MFRKLTVFVCLLSFSPAAAGAQELALLAGSQPALVQSTDREQVREINLTPPVYKLAAATVVAANEHQGHQMTEAQRPRKTHTGLTFQEFADVHFGEYRWIYWVGAVAAIVALHVVVAD